MIARGGDAISAAWVREAVEITRMVAPALCDLAPGEGFITVLTRRRGVVTRISDDGQRAGRSEALHDIDEHGAVEVLIEALPSDVTEDQARGTRKEPKRVDADGFIARRFQPMVKVNRLVIPERRTV